MTISLKELKNKSPMFISGYTNVIVPNSELPKKWNQSESFVTKKIVCPCGSKDFQLNSSQIVKIKGIFKKKEIVTHLAPLTTECPKCNSSALLLDPTRHGWSGEFGESASLVGENDPTPYAKETGEVLVNYSYQSFENYEDLQNEGISNLEDYFDTVTVYFKSGNGYVEVVSYVCA
ncbi:hypothetical protein [Reinekea sp. G2M2-21]|uniref:hypothetical protein n=1 Tax=Reinekea sp. G2M2-21 TaxID=2788942 RepID=UPI0018A98DB6|nr:hypothetical protein [Reinekea sp. G2M2-21]